MPLKPFTGTLDTPAEAGAAAAGLKPFEGELDRDWAELARDSGAQLLGGLAGLGGSVYHLANLASGGRLDDGLRAVDLAPYQAVQQAERYWAEVQSPAARDDAQALQQAQGVTDTLEVLAERPRLVGQQIVQSLPYLVPLAGAARYGRLAGAGQARVRGLSGAAAESLAARGSQTATALTEGALEGGDAGRQAHDRALQADMASLAQQPAYQDLLAQGLSPEAARQQLAQASGALATVVAAPIGALAGQLTGASQLEAQALTGRHSGLSLGRALGAEMAQEALQEGGNQFGSNLATARFVDAQQALDAELAKQATLGAVVGGTQGGGVKLVDALQARRDVPAASADPIPPSPPDAPDTPLTAPSADTGAEAPAASPTFHTASPKPWHSPQAGPLSRAVGAGVEAGSVADPTLTGEWLGPEPDWPVPLPPHAPPSPAPAPTEPTAPLPGTGSPIVATAPPPAQEGEGLPPAEPDAAPPAGQAFDPAFAQGANQGEDIPALQAHLPRQPALLTEPGLPKGPAPWRAAKPQREHGGTPPPTETHRDVRIAEPQARALLERHGWPGVEARNWQEDAELSAEYDPADFRRHLRSASDDEVSGRIAGHQDEVNYGERWDAPEVVRRVDQDRLQASKDEWARRLEAKAHEAATSPRNSLPQPTPAQQEAGNYRKGHLRLHGLDLSIEHPAGSRRSGTDPDGKPWQTTLQHHYGYIKGTVGRDKDHVDVFVGPQPDSRKVFVVDQVRPTDGKFDEHKVMLGFDSAAEARQAYQANYADNWQGLGQISETDVDTFKQWLKTGNTRSPFGKLPKLSGPTGVLSENSGSKPDSSRFRFEAGKLVTDAPLIEHTTGKGKVKTGVLVPHGVLTAEQAKQLYAAPRKDGVFVAEKHLVRDRRDQTHASSPVIAAPPASTASEQVAMGDGRPVHFAQDAENRLAPDDPGKPLPENPEQADPAAGQDLHVRAPAADRTARQGEAGEPAERGEAFSTADEHKEDTENAQPRTNPQDAGQRRAGPAATTPAAAEPDAAEAPQQDDKLAARRRAPNRGIRSGALHLQLARLTGRWTGVPTIRVVQSVAELPATLRHGAEMMEGFYHPASQTAYLIADNLASAERAEHVLLHEVMGHAGLRAVLGEALPSVLAGIQRNPAIRQQVADLQRAFPDYDRLRATEEVLAELAASGQIQKQGFWRMLVAAVRHGLRKLGFVTAWTNHDIAALLARARRQIERGGGKPQRDDGVLASRLNQRARWRWVDRWTDQSGLPSFANDEVMLAFPVDESADLLNRNQMTDGSRAGRYRVFNIESEQLVAEVVLEMDGDQVLGLHDLDVVAEFRRQGIGQMILASLLANQSAGQMLHIFDVIPKARSWWEKNGVGYIDQLYGNTVLDWRDFSQAHTRAAARAQPAAANTRADTRDAGNDGAGESTQERDGSAGDERLASFARYQSAIRSAQDLLQSDRTFNRWWHQSVGTQFHKATISPEFKRVFDSGQAYLYDVSRLSMRAEAAAPGLLPKIGDVAELWRNGRAAFDPARRQAIKLAGKAVFDGTLRWTRDDAGQLRLAGDNESGGVVFSDAELRQQFGLNDAAIALYRQSRQAIDTSLDDLARSTLFRLLADSSHISPNIVQSFRFTEASLATLRKVIKVELAQAQQHMVRAGLNQQARLIGNTWRRIEDVIDKTELLKAQGYAPLMRFGKYAVDAKGADGQRLAFQLFESQLEASWAARQLRQAYPDADVSTGVLSEEGYKLFRGLTPETVALFAKELGLDKESAMQDYLQLAISNRSAMKRLIHRKGIEGYSEDLARVAASFIVSNSRQAAGNYHRAEMMDAANNIPKEMGDVKDEAARLIQYLTEPKEEAAGLRGFLFLNFLGGSVASAAVNLTQPLLMTLPYLAQFGGEAKAAKRLLAAVPKAMGKGLDPQLQAALQAAEERGIVAPHEIHQLMAEAGGTLLDRNYYVRAAKTVWGSLFAATEAVNRRLTFIAAYETARAERIRNPFDFAERAVQETQGIYNRGNRPNWARGALGATVFTFKQYSIVSVRSHHLALRSPSHETPGFDWWESGDGAVM